MRNGAPTSGPVLVSGGDGDAGELGWSGVGNGRPRAKLGKKSGPRVGLAPRKEKEGHGPVGLLPGFGFGWAGFSISFSSLFHISN